MDGQRLQRPITMEVIGDSHSLEEAARFRGGLVSEITGPRIGGSVSIERLDEVRDHVLAQPGGESVRSASVCRAHPAVIDDRSTRPGPLSPPLQERVSCLTTPKT